MDPVTLAGKLIVLAEGCKLVAYWDPTGKVWTIGFGHTKGVKQGDTCTIEQAAEWLVEDMEPLVRLTKGRSLIESAMNISFGYNCGIGRLERLLKAVDLRVTVDGFIALDIATNQWLPFGEESGGVPLLGLKRRRQFEAAMIMAARG